jgi:hypothetical protein
MKPPFGPGLQTEKEKQHSAVAIKDSQKDFGRPASTVPHSPPPTKNTNPPPDLQASSATNDQVFEKLYDLPACSMFLSDTTLQLNISLTM